MSASGNVADAIAREKALAVDRSFIVQAPAGSGKTALLTRRVLRLLAIVDHPEEIIAITFTRKAAAEMRNRILAALDAARGPRPEKPEEIAIYELAVAALARDHAQGWNMGQCPERLRISTIDSFCATLVRQMPMLSRLGAMPEVTENAQSFYREAARALLAHLETDEKISPAIARLLRHLDNNLPKIEELIAGMLQRRDQWMRHLGSGKDRPDRAVLEKGLARIAADALQALHGAIPGSLAQEILWLGRYAGEHLEEQDLASSIRFCCGLTELPPANGAYLDVWRGVYALLNTSEGDWRKRVDARQGFPPPGGSSDPAERSRRKEAKERFNALIEALRAVDGLTEHFALVPALPPPHYAQTQWDLVEALCELLPLAVAELWLIFQQRRVADFTQLAWGALQALGNTGEPTDLALMLDYRIRHLLIDEFQDTSVSQFDLIAQLTGGWEGGDGRTLFVVGDPMQSIYRFRQAEVGLFLRAWHRGIGGVRLEPLRLTVNFRSQQGVVEWVNKAFPSIFSRGEDIATGAVAYAPSIAYHGYRTAPAVAVHPLIGRVDPDEAEVVAALVDAAMADSTQKTIAILVRSRTHLGHIALRLRSKGLRFRAIEIEALGHRTAVQDLLTLTRALVHPGDRLSWLALLRAPWCALTLADLETVAGAESDTAVWELMQEPQRVDRLSVDGRARLERVRAVMADCSERTGRESLRRLVERAWIALGGPACCADRTDLGDAFVYLDLLEECEAGGEISDLSELSRQVDELFALPDLQADQRLQLMTIHKAKGLEFHTVIVPGLGRIPRAPDAALLAWAERPNAGTSEVDLLLAPIRGSGADPDPIFEYLKNFEKLKSAHEDGRLLYVAATRAIDCLHLLGQVMIEEQEGNRRLRIPDRRSLLYRLWPVVRADFEKAFEPLACAAVAGADVPDTVRHRLVRRLPRAWHLPDPPPAVAWKSTATLQEESGEARVEFDWAQETIRHVGSVVHGILQQMGREGVATWDAQRVRALRPLIAARLAEAGVPPGQIDAAVQRSEAGVLGVLCDERGRWILDSAHSDSRCEYALSAVLGGELRNVVLDRTFVDAAGIRWIIDYKTSSHEGGAVEEFLDRERERYRPQLERYAKIMSKIDGRTMRLGLYFPLIGGWREWSPE
ncbi:MAG: UvrD-helicase domain-containing protein [Acidiferrobacterales bacterium]